VSSLAEEAAAAAIKAEITGETIEFGVKDVLAGIAGDVVGSVGDAAKASVRRTGSITKSVSQLIKRLPSGAQQGIKRVASKFSKVLPSSPKEFDLFADDAAEVFAKQIKNQLSISGRILRTLTSSRSQKIITNIGAKFSEVATDEIKRDEEDSGNFFTKLVGVGVASVFSLSARIGLKTLSRSPSRSGNLDSQVGFRTAGQSTRFRNANSKRIDIIDDIQSAIDFDEILEPYFEAKSGDA